MPFLSLVLTSFFITKTWQPFFQAFFHTSLKPHFDSSNYTHRYTIGVVRVPEKDSM